MVKKGIYKKLDVGDAHVTVHISDHAAGRINNKTDPRRAVNEFKILKMIDDAVPESINTLYGHSLASSLPMALVIHSRSGAGSVVEALAMRRGAQRDPQGKTWDVVDITVTSVHGRTDFVARSPGDYEMEVNGTSMELLFEAGLSQELKNAVATLVRTVLTEDDVEEATAYHVADELVDFWMTPLANNRIDIELPKFIRETYMIELP